MAAGGDKPETYIEFIVQGGLVKATAIDGATGTEACIFGPVSASRDALARNAAAKLAYVLKKKKEKGE
jgi:hypothetical protein